MSRAQLIPLGAGVVAALLHLSAAYGSPVGFLLAYFAQTPLAFVGFGFGFMPAAISSALAAVIVGVAAPGVGSLTLFLAVTVLPVLLVVYLALTRRTGVDESPEWYPTGRILGWLTVLALGAFALGLTLFSAGEGGLSTQISRYLETLLAGFQNVSAEVRENTVRMMTLYFPGTAAASWFLMVVVNCLLGQKLASSLGTNIRPTPVYKQTEAPSWPVLVIAIGAGISLLDGLSAFVYLNMMVIAGIPFIINGFALLHCLSIGWPARRLVLSLCYVFSVILLWPMAVVAGLGIVETWVRYRARASAQQAKKRTDLWK